MMLYRNILLLMFSLALASCDNNDQDTNSTGQTNNPVAQNIASNSYTNLDSDPDSSKQGMDASAIMQQAEPGITIASSPDPLTIARQSGCLACHKLDKKLVGPAWRDVAARYASNLQAKEVLITKVKTGGKGNWNEITGGAPMPPYSPRVSDKNIELLVDYVLSLNQ